MTERHWTQARRIARDAGYDVHHDMLGWFVVAPGEDDPADGYSLGFDGRDHFSGLGYAWLAAAQIAFTDFDELVSP